MARTATGIDIGACTAKALRGSYKGGTLHVTGFAVGSTSEVAEVAERDILRHAVGDIVAPDDDQRELRTQIGREARDLGGEVG